MGPLPIGMFIMSQGLTSTMLHIREHAFTHHRFGAWRSYVHCARLDSLLCRAEALNSQQQRQLKRRAVLVGFLSAPAAVRSANALGIEAIPPAEKVEGGFLQLRKRNQELLDKGAEAFENSDILRKLREQTDANKAKNRKALQDLYCRRQAEMGVGDCAGLRLIPGATKSGKQKTPEWLKSVLQKVGRLPPDETPTKAPQQSKTAANDD